AWRGGNRAQAAGTAPGLETLDFRNRSAPSDDRDFDRFSRISPTPLACAPPQACAECLFCLSAVLGLEAVAGAAGEAPFCARAVHFSFRGGFLPQGRRP